MRIEEKIDVYSSPKRDGREDRWEEKMGQKGIEQKKNINKYM
jgi:hypothetical protein